MMSNWMKFFLHLNLKINQANSRAIPRGGERNETSYHEIYREWKEICRELAADRSVREELLLFKKKDRNIKAAAGTATLT